jgi:hypothetical protein
MVSSQRSQAYRLAHKPFNLLRFLHCHIGTFLRALSVFTLSHRTHLHFSSSVLSARHLDWHLEVGLAVVFAEAPAEQRSGPQSQIIKQEWLDLCPIYNALSPDLQ